LDTLNLSRHLLGLIQRSDETGQGSPVIIRLKDRSTYLRCCDHLGPIGHRLKKLEMIHSISCRLHPDDLNQLKEYASVLSVESDVKVKLHQGATAAGETVPWGIRRMGVQRLPDSITQESTVKALSIQESTFLTLTLPKILPGASM
jgi:hypothetical protein